MKREMDLLTMLNKDLSKEVREMKENNAKLIAERDQFRLDTSELYKNKKIIEKQYAHDKIQNKEREVKLQKQLAQANKENNEYQDEILMLNKAVK